MSRKWLQDKPDNKTCGRPARKGTILYGIPSAAAFCQMGVFDPPAIKKSIGRMGRKHRSQGTTLVTLCRNLEQQTKDHPAIRQDVER